MDAPSTVNSKKMAKRIAAVTRIIKMNLGNSPNPKKNRLKVPQLNNGMERAVSP